MDFVFLFDHHPLLELRRIRVTGSSSLVRSISRSALGSRQFAFREHFVDVLHHDHYKRRYVRIRQTSRFISADFTAWRMIAVVSMLALGNASPA